MKRYTGLIFLVLILSSGCCQAKKYDSIYRQVFLEFLEDLNPESAEIKVIAKTGAEGSIPAQKVLAEFWNFAVLKSMEIEKNVSSRVFKKETGNDLTKVMLRDGEYPVNMAGSVIARAYRDFYRWAGNEISLEDLQHRIDSIPDTGSMDGITAIMVKASVPPQLINSLKATIMDKIDRAIKTVQVSGGKAAKEFELSRKFEDYRTRLADLQAQLDQKLLKINRMTGLWTMGEAVESILSRYNPSVPMHFSSYNYQIAVFIEDATEFVFGIGSDLKVNDTNKKDLKEKIAKAREFYKEIQDSVKASSAAIAKECQEADNISAEFETLKSQYVQFVADNSDMFTLVPLFDIKAAQEEIKITLKNFEDFKKDLENVIASKMKFINQTGL